MGTIRKIRSNRERLIVCLAVTFALGLAAHAFIFFSPGYSHDSLLVNQAPDNMHQLLIGRFLQPLYRMIRGNITATWLTGLLALLFQSAASYFIVKLLEIKSIAGTGLICALLVTCSTVTFSAATYAPWLDVFMLTLLLSVLAVYLCGKYKFGFLFGAVLICLSFGLYQGYIGTAIGLVMILAVRDALEKKPLKAIGLRVGKAALMVCAGAALYFLTAKIVLMFAGGGLSDSYNSIGGLSNFPFSNIIKIFGWTYIHFIREILLRASNQAALAVCVAVIAALCLFWLIRLIKIKKVSALYTLLIFIVIAFMPFGMNITYFVSPNVYHSLMAYGCFLIYAFAVLLYEKYTIETKQMESQPEGAPIRRGRKIPRYLFTALAAFIVFSNIVFSNGVYTGKYLQEKATLSVMTRVADRMEQTEGYVPSETPVVFAGTLNSAQAYTAIPGFEKYSGVGIDGFRYAVTYPKTYFHYLTYYLGIPAVAATQEKYDSLLKSPEVKNMAAFPADGSCKMVDGCLVIKLSALNE